MRITVRELFNAPKAFGDLVDKELPLEVALKLRRFNKAIGDEIQIYDPERIKIFEKHGCPKNGNNYDFEALFKSNPGKAQKLNDELAAFNNKELDLKCEPLSAKDLGNVKVKPASLILLESFIGD